MTSSNYSVVSPYGMSSDLPCNVTLSPMSSTSAVSVRLSLMKQSVSVTALFSVAYGIVFIFGVVNNSLVVSVIYRNIQMRTITNYFIANLAVADILVSFIVLPFTLMNNILSDWLFGVFLCKAIGYLQTVAVGASVNTLAAVAVERYLAIYYPHLTIITARRALVIIGIIWLIPACIQLPWAIYNNVNVFTTTDYGYIRVCSPRCTIHFLRNFVLYGVFLTCYMIPLCFLTIFYTLIGMRVWKRNVAGIRGSQAERNITRSKKRILRMLIVVTVFFTLSWLPLYVMHLHGLYGASTTHAQKQRVMNILKPITQWLGSANSCMNPFIYCYFSKHFRRSILAVLRSGSCCGKINMTQHNEVTATRTHL